MSISLVPGGSMGSIRTTQHRSNLCNIKNWEDKGCNCTFQGFELSTYP